MPISQDLLDRIKRQDPELTELSFKKSEELTSQDITNLASALKSNNVVTSLDLSNIILLKDDEKALIDMLTHNYTIKTISLYEYTSPSFITYKMKMNKSYNDIDEYKIRKLVEMNQSDVGKIAKLIACGKELLSELSKEWSKLMEKGSKPNIDLLEKNLQYLELLKTELKPTPLAPIYTNYSRVEEIIKFYDDHYLARPVLRSSYDFDYSESYFIRESWFHWTEVERGVPARLAGRVGSISLNESQEREYVAKIREIIEPAQSALEKAKSYLKIDQSSPLTLSKDSGYITKEGKSKDSDKDSSSISSSSSSYYSSSSSGLCDSVLLEDTTSLGDID